MVGSYPLLSQAPTPGEVELGCDNTLNQLFKYSSVVEIWITHGIMRLWDGTIFSIILEK